MALIFAARVIYVCVYVCR